MKYRFLFFLLFITLSVQGGNKVLSPRFKSLTTIVNGDWMNRPVMILASGDELEIGFDELSHNYHRLVYHLDHCEQDWTVSDGLFESDWLEGFNDNPIDDYLNSINTTIPYTHYHFSLPNDRCRMKMSGNYRLTVLDEDADNEEVLVVEFYVVEPLMNVSLTASTNTDIDHNQQHQQVSMDVQYNSLRVTNIDEQIYTVVMQNWREDNARRNVRPSMQTTRGLEWSHHRQLIFPAGNEYHKFEVLDVSHPTMGIDHIEWDGHYYQAYPFATTVRKNYLTDVDADGAFIIRNSDRREEAYTCDYVWVNYQLLAPYQGELYINGHWTVCEPRETYLMQYDANTQSYYARILQKQGYYSYQYLCADGSQPVSEGNFYQTENRYQAFIYYKGVGERTWRLVGYRAIVLR